MNKNSFLIVSLITFCTSAYAMTNQQAETLAKKAVKGNTAALSSLKTAALGGDSNAENWLGNCLIVKHHYKQGIFWLQKTADQKNAGGELSLGYAYYYGHGVPQNYAKAIYWFQKAANQGYTLAEFALGIAYYHGHGVPQDYAKAIYWFQKAANQGYNLAEFALGIAYYHGQGVPQNSMKALYWFKKAAAQGNQLAKQGIQIIKHGSTG